MKKYIPINFKRKELDALHTAIQNRIISDLKHFPEALLYWEKGLSFYMEEEYFENSINNIDATLTYPNIPPTLAQELRHLLQFMESSLYGGMVQPGDISKISHEMEDYNKWHLKIK
jgi:hypothetical protein